MQSSDQSSWKLGPKQLGVLLAYSGLAPATVYFVSLERTWSALVALIGVLLTLPFWPLLSVVLYGVSHSGSPPVLLWVAWLAVFLQSWYTLSELRVRARVKGRSTGAELMALLGRSTVLIATIVIVALAAMAYYVRMQP